MPRVRQAPGRCRAPRAALAGRLRRAGLCGAAAPSLPPRLRPGPARSAAVPRSEVSGRARARAHARLAARAAAAGDRHALAPGPARSRRGGHEPAAFVLDGGRRWRRTTRDSCRRTIWRSPYCARGLRPRRARLRSPSIGPGPTRPRVFALARARPRRGRARGWRRVLLAPGEEGRGAHPVPSDAPPSTRWGGPAARLGQTGWRPR
jgi:hypothetical protein